MGTLSRTAGPGGGPRCPRGELRGNCVGSGRSRWGLRGDGQTAAKGPGHAEGMLGVLRVPSPRRSDTRPEHLERPAAGVHQACEGKLTAGCIRRSVTSRPSSSRRPITSRSRRRLRPKSPRGQTAGPSCHPCQERGSAWRTAAHFRSRSRAGDLFGRIQATCRPRSPTWRRSKGGGRLPR